MSGQLAHSPGTLVVVELTRLVLEVNSSIDQREWKLGVLVHEAIKIFACLLALSKSTEDLVEKASVTEAPL